MPTGPVSATVTLTTGAASDITATTATLNAAYSGLSPVNVQNVGFKWGLSETALTNTAYDNSSFTSASGSISATISSLDANTTYYYQATMMVYDQTTKSYVEFTGEVKSFTTTTSTTSSVPKWLELPAYTVEGLSGTTSSSLSDLYFLKHSASEMRNYTALYDPEMYASYWVAYPLSSCHIGSGRKDNYAYDPDVPEAKQTYLIKGSYKVSLSTENYENNLYSRGHQIPNGDRSASDALSDQTYYMTNLTPQIQNGFNGGIWNNLETAVRDLVSSCDTVYVITGAAFRDKTIGTETINTIVNGRDGKTIPVPNYYWKALLKVRWSGNTVVEASTIGFWLPHKDLKGQDYADYTLSVTDIESKTGIDIFTNLPDTIEATAEANTSWSTFQSF